jgi:hypothetical protein
MNFIAKVVKINPNVIAIKVLIKIYNIAPKKPLLIFIEAIFTNTIQAIRNLKRYVISLGIGSFMNSKIYLGISVKKDPRTKYLKGSFFGESFPLNQRAPLPINKETK